MATTSKESISLPPASKADINFTESSFFKNPSQQLPSPSSIDTSGRQDIARFPELGLVVKYGRNVTRDEAITMWTVRKWLGDRVPIPEVFGWKSRGEFGLIYMELISGVTLQERWKDPEFTEADKATICQELKEMISLIREQPRESNEEFIGSITRGPLLDRVFYERPAAGPFENLDSFYAWMEWLPQRFLDASQKYRDPYLERMPTDSAIVLTHADVHPTNIMVPASGPPRILALIDWGQSGWYPDWWEYFKMCYTTHWEDDWRKEWIPKMVEAREDEWDLMAEYVMTIGAL